MKLSGTSAIVTGGASGLGWASATRLVDAGARVIIADLPGGDGASAAARLGAGARFVAADVSDEAALAEAVAAAREDGPLRTLVTCAGIAPPAKVLGRDGIHSLSLFETVLKVNLLGTFNAIRLAAEAMATNEPIDGQRGVIITTASVAAFEGQIGQAAYSASKGGVAAMTLPIARELARDGIRVNTIAPGIFETPLMAGLPEAARVSLGEQVPFPARLGRPEEFADLVAAIIDNPYLNGETIRLDGAIRLAPR